MSGRDPQRSIDGVIGARRVVRGVWHTRHRSHVVGTEIQVDGEPGTEIIRARGGDPQLVRIDSGELAVSGIDEGRRIDGVRGCREGACRASQAHDRFALLAEARDNGDGSISVAAPAGFAVEQYLRNDGREIPAHAGAIVLELLHHPIDVTRTWIAGHEPLDQLAADVGRNVVVVRDVINHPVQFGQAVEIIGMIGTRADTVSLRAGHGGDARGAADRRRGDGGAGDGAHSS